jgi:hypothetical protein
MTPIELLTAIALGNIKITQINPCPYVTVRDGSFDDATWAWKFYEKYADFIMFLDGRPISCKRYEVKK